MTMKTVTLEQSDFHKILDALVVARRHHRLRDRANAQLHLAETVRFSPLTTVLDVAIERLVKIEAEQLSPEEPDHE